MYKKLLDKINEYSTITIFRHIRPDGDCMFSALALYHFLKDNFKDKKVKLLGYEKYDLVSRNDIATEKFISNSLSIILDSASKERIDDERALNSKYIIKIDHHPAFDNYGNMNIVHPEASSTCQILTEILFSKDFNKFNISDKVCEFLYSGIITDTLNFRTSNTTAKTHKAAELLMNKSNINASDVYDYINNKSYDYFKRINKIRDSLIVDKEFGYIKLNKKQLNEFKMDPIDAKNNIDEIGNISDLNVWAFAVEVNSKWDVSIRSKHGYIINEVARKYKGGGHANACGVKQLTTSELNKMFNELMQISTKHKKL